jgi:hypothetical protein
MRQMSQGSTTRRPPIRLVNRGGAARLRTQPVVRLRLVSISSRLSNCPRRVTCSRPGRRGNLVNRKSPGRRVSLGNPENPERRVKLVSLENRASRVNLRLWQLTPTRRALPTSSPAERLKAQRLARRANRTSCGLPRRPMRLRFHRDATTKR